jgi:DNA-binding response OmpR family regulator
MDLKAVRILFVDDSRRTAEIVQSILGSVGARDIRHAMSAHEAFDQLRREVFDLLIVDQHLDRDNAGVDLVKRIRNDPASPSPYVAILMLTGDTKLRQVQAARDAGVTDFLGKPFTAGGLLRRIEAMILQSRPFVRSFNYFGPDRRRREDPNYTGMERRRSPS